MTPFGARVRALRAARGMTLNELAARLTVSPAYLSALEHGRRGRPQPGLVMQVCGALDLIWDEAETLKALAAVSAPRVTLNTGGLSPLATELANRLAARLSHLDDDTLAALLETVRDAPDRPR
ncbi:helix-turn-helix transcriptional regulator [Roseospira marina]|uniref:Helix-turn-helix transcriptional regulator n=1 Tax=Roseospira marina TaxID=140057 RepID=A0A5M6I7U3_9PROT|nr:helix-turn-helix domain-containing protein [Roseospira marina]KAA5604311.1 helix-turn-helix transcriptional regulator [Roseospira marina]MBB4315665.1 transcriptional regulator with XRE-family HTH domain [Roseospira marina]MBB5088723.1 transcriptional regulator with XRE-family HTH domain [Roseospira marina]